MTSLQDPAAPASAVSLWWLHRTLTLTRAPLAVPIGRRHNVVAVAMGAPGTHVRWPFPARLAAGRTTIVHLERTRRIAFEMEPRRPSGHVHFGWLHVDPRRVGTLPEERRTGLAMHGYRGGYEAPALTAGVVFSNVPRVPLTGVVHSADGWFAVEVDAESTALPIALGAAPVRPLASMSIDGAPPPAGTVVLPGTVADDLVNAVLARGWLDDPLDPDGLGVRTPEPDAWRPARLPAADSLTAWHRDRGLARLRWTENGVAVGAWEPGSVHVSRHPANHARATLSVRSGCVGSSQVSSGSSRVDGMERPLRSTEISLLGGIPFGSVALELRTWRKGEAEPVVFRETVTLDAESPCARFSLVEDGTVRFDGTGTVPPTGR